MKYILLLLLVTLSATGLAQDVTSIVLPDSTTNYLLSKDLKYVTLIKPVKKKSYSSFTIQRTIDGKSIWESTTNASGYPTHLFPTGILCAIVPNGGLKNPYRLFYRLDGTEICKYPYDICYINPRKDIIIGYRNIKAVAYKLSTGEQLWKASIPCKYPLIWRNITHLDPDHIIFTAKKTNILNLKTGEVISRDSKTEISDFRVQLVGSAMAFLTDNASAGATSLDDIQSNFLIHSNRIYHSDRNHLICLDNSLQEIWSYKFTQVKGSHANLRLVNDTLVLISDGTGRNNFGNYIKRSTPFIASFNKDTGEMINLDSIPDSPDKKIFGKNLRIATDSFYTFNSNNKLSLITPQTNEILIFDKDGNLHLVNKFLRSLHQYPQLETYIKGSSWKNYSIICRYGDHPDFYIIKDDNEVYMHLEPGYNQVSFKGNYLILESEDKVEFKLFKPE